VKWSALGGDMSDFAGSVVVNVAATCLGTRVLGPGMRSAVWVQGCPLACRGCLAPEWIPERAARLVSPAVLAAELLADPRVTGLTISGGEPMAQAAGLARMISVARASRELTVICYSGYRLAELHGGRPPADAESLLAEIDVLIDGRYVAAHNDGRGLRGSANQRIHHLTDRLRGYDFEGGPRSAELHFSDSEVQLVGVPPDGLLEALARVPDRLSTPAGLSLTADLRKS
jgi:anaerobic ribonucleoside-triphosphate reductase activating protein